jgi:predicted Na+-dependent transporter
LKVEIGRDKVQMNIGINIGFTIILVIALFFMGLEIDLKLVLKVLKRPVGPTIGMVSQFLFMPICAYGLGELLLTEGKVCFKEWGNFYIFISIFIHKI